MAYTPRFSRREDGGYDAAYGKASKKLTAVLLQGDKGWHVTEGFAAGQIPASKKLKDVKEAWGARAEEVYGTVHGEADPTPPPAAPAAPRLGPPSLIKRATEVFPAPRVPPPSLRVAQGLDVHVPASTFLAEERSDTRPRTEPGTHECARCSQPLSGWHKGRDGTLKPPCRCDFPNTEDYAPDPLDPRMYERDYENTYRKITPIGALDVVYAWMLRNPEYVTTNGKLDRVWAFVQDTLYRTTGYAEYRPQRWEPGSGQEVIQPQETTDGTDTAAADGGGEASADGLGDVGGDDGEASGG